MDRFWDSIIGESSTYEIPEKTMDSKEFVKMLKGVAKEGTGILIPGITMSKNIPEKYQVIFDALDVVCKIGGKTLQDGIERLSKDYPEKVNSLNFQGWGVKPNKRPKITIGEQRAIYGIVRKNKKNFKNLWDTCFELNIGFDKFSDSRALINKIDKKNMEAHIQNITWNEEKVEITSITVREHLDILEYMGILENKIHVKIELTDLEKKLYDFIRSTYNKYNPVKIVY